MTETGVFVLLIYIVGQCSGEEVLCSDRNRRSRSFLELVSPRVNHL